CTLVDAILSANTDTAVGGCVAGSGIDSLVLNADVNLNSIYAGSSTFGYAQAGLPDITSEIIIFAGTGDTISRTNGTSAPYFRIFNVAATGSLDLSGVTVQGGRIQGADVIDFDPATVI